MSVTGLIQFLGRKKIQWTLAIVGVAFFITSICLHHHPAEHGFSFLGMATAMVYSMPFYYADWIRHRTLPSDQRLFLFIMGTFIGGLLAGAILFLAQASNF